ncbi:MAG: sulfite exporter TauE/SafE family protein [Burkholderiales bacterium]|nr:sulfite exporter TauE/SafE family protein [Burkholderiales bacterium]
MALAAIALAVGFFIGAVGVGGILLIPALVWLGGVHVHQATATALFSFMFTGFAGTCLFQRRGSIDWHITLPVLGGALIFSYLGARANAMVNAQALTLIVALLVVFAGAYILLPAPRENAAHRDGRTRAQQLLLVIVGALAGFGSGLSGAGGPLFSVPMMLVLGFAPLAVIGASQVLQIVAALAGTVGNLQFGSIDFMLAGWITLFELAGVVAGARAAHALSLGVLRRSAGGLCLLTGLLLLARSL